jgi:F0F1-type ATP synthase assembly protein I
VEKVTRYSRQAALAMELPFTMAGAVVVGGLVGYFLDQWWHTSPWLMAVFGAIGFIGGIREVIRRLTVSENGPSDGTKSS